MRLLVPALVARQYVSPIRYVGHSPVVLVAVLQVNLFAQIPVRINVQPLVFYLKYLIQHVMVVSVRHVILPDKLRILVRVLVAVLQVKFWHL